MLGWPAWEAAGEAEPAPPETTPTCPERSPAAHTRVPSPQQPAHLPRRILTVAICKGGVQLCPTGLYGPLPLSPGPGVRLPSPLGSSVSSLHHISTPPRSVAQARGRARGGSGGARGCACIPRLLLAAHAVHGSEGASPGGSPRLPPPPGLLLRLLASAAALPAPLRLRPANPRALRADHRSPAARS